MIVSMRFLPLLLALFMLGPLLFVPSPVAAVVPQHLVQDQFTVALAQYQHYYYNVTVDAGTTLTWTMSINSTWPTKPGDLYVQNVSLAIPYLDVHQHDLVAAGNLTHTLTSAYAGVMCFNFINMNSGGGGCDFYIQYLQPNDRYVISLDSKPGGTYAPIQYPYIWANQDHATVTAYPGSRIYGMTGTFFMPNMNQPVHWVGTNTLYDGSTLKWTGDGCDFWANAVSAGNNITNTYPDQDLLTSGLTKHGPVLGGSTYYQYLNSANNWLTTTSTGYIRFGMGNIPTPLATSSIVSVTFEYYVLINSVWTYQSHTYDLNPQTSTPWTATTVNSIYGDYRKSGTDAIIRIWVSGVQQPILYTNANTNGIKMADIKVVLTPPHSSNGPGISYGYLFPADAAHRMLYANDLFMFGGSVLTTVTGHVYYANMDLYGYSASGVLLAQKHITITIREPVATPQQFNWLGGIVWLFIFFCVPMLMNFSWPKWGGLMGMVLMGIALGMTATTADLGLGASSSTPFLWVSAIIILSVGAIIMRGE